MCVSVQYDRLHVVFVVGDNLLAICIRPNGTSREAEESTQLDQIFSKTAFLFICFFDREVLNVMVGSNERRELGQVPFYMY